MIQRKNLPEPFNKPEIEERLQKVCQENDIAFIVVGDFGIVLRRG